MDTITHEDLSHIVSKASVTVEASLMILTAAAAAALCCATAA